MNGGGAESWPWLLEPGRSRPLPTEGTGPPGAAACALGSGTCTITGELLPKLPWVPGPIATPTKSPKPSAIADSGAVQRRSITGSAAQRIEANRSAVHRSGRTRPRTSRPGTLIASLHRPGAGPPRADWEPG